MEAAIKGKVEVTILLLQSGADPNLLNAEGRPVLELATAQASGTNPASTPSAATRAVLTGEYRKDELLEAARSGAEDRLAALLTPLNVNCHAADGRRSTPLHLAAGYNRLKIVQLLLRAGADVQAKDKGGLGKLFSNIIGNIIFFIFSSSSTTQQLQLRSPGGL